MTRCLLTGVERRGRHRHVPVGPRRDRRRGVRPNIRRVAVWQVNSKDVMARSELCARVPTYFEDIVWPALARRIPAMERVRLQRGAGVELARALCTQRARALPDPRAPGGRPRELRARERFLRTWHHARASRGPAHGGAPREWRPPNDRSLLLLVPAHPRGTPVSRARDRLTWANPPRGRSRTDRLAGHASRWSQTAGAGPHTHESGPAHRLYRRVHDRAVGLGSGSRHRAGRVRR